MQQFLVPEIYGNGYLLNVTETDVTITLIDKTKDGINPVPKVHIRIPLMTAKDLSIALRRVMTGIEKELGYRVPVNMAYMQKLGISLDDMPDYWPLGDPR